MDWERVNSCKHEWTDYWDSGACATPYCSWHEIHCRKCRVYKVECTCGFESGMSGEPRYMVMRRHRKKIWKEIDDGREQEYGNME